MTALHPITLGAIRLARPCTLGWVRLLCFLGHDDGKYDPSRQVTLGDIAASNGAPDALWCGRLLPAEARKDLIRAVLPAIKRAAVRTTDQYALDCTAAIDAWLAGEAVDLESFVHVRPESWSAWWAVAQEAALPAAMPVMSSAAMSAARAAVLARDVEGRAAVERQAQIADIIAVFGRLT